MLKLTCASSDQILILVTQPSSVSSSSPAGLFGIQRLLEAPVHHKHEHWEEQGLWKPHQNKKGTLFMLINDRFPDVVSIDDFFFFFKDVVLKGLIFSCFIFFIFFLEICVTGYPPPCHHKALCQRCQAWIVWRRAAPVLRPYRRGFRFHLLFPLPSLMTVASSALPFRCSSPSSQVRPRRTPPCALGLYE